MKLSVYHRHMITLTVRDRDDEGWAKVSETLLEPIKNLMTPELFVFEKLEKGGRVRLTEEGGAQHKASKPCRFPNRSFAGAGSSKERKFVRCRLSKCFERR